MHNRIEYIHGRACSFLTIDTTVFALDRIIPNDNVIFCSKESVGGGVGLD
jgi:hypothetical protein